MLIVLNTIYPLHKVVQTDEYVAFPLRIATASALPYFQQINVELAVNRNLKR